MATQLTAEALLASGAATHAVRIPLSLLRGEAANADGTGYQGSAGEVTLRPLLVRDVDRVVRASREQRVLASVLMVQQALVAPKMSVEQVGDLPAGVVQFLADRVNAIYGKFFEGRYPARSVLQQNLEVHNEAVEQISFIAVKRSPTGQAAKGIRTRPGN